MSGIGVELTPRKTKMKKCYDLIAHLHGKLSVEELRTKNPKLKGDLFSITSILDPKRMINMTLDERLCVLKNALRIMNKIKRVDFPPIMGYRAEFSKIIDNPLLAAEIKPEEEDQPPSAKSQQSSSSSRQNQIPVADKAHSSIDYRARLKPSERGHNDLIEGRSRRADAASMDRKSQGHKKIEDVRKKKGSSSSSHPNSGVHQSPLVPQRGSNSHANGETRRTDLKDFVRVNEDDVIQIDSVPEHLTKYSRSMISKSREIIRRDLKMLVGDIAFEDCINGCGNQAQSCKHSKVLLMQVIREALVKKTE